MADDNKNDILLKGGQIQIDQNTQQTLNQPLKDDEGIDPKDSEFLKMLIDKIDRKEINLLQPSTLLNHAFYDKLDEKSQGKADYDAFNLLASIREINQLWQAGNRDTYQIIYFVHKMRLTKEHLEELGGDIYII
jgi:hypothetical protein